MASCIRCGRQVCCGKKYCELCEMEVEYIEKKVKPAVKKEKNGSR